MGKLYCDACCNTGELDCHCGGDLCICDRHGTYECPHCEGGRLDDDEYPDYDLPAGPVPSQERK